MTSCRLEVFREHRPIPKYIRSLCKVQLRRLCMNPKLRRVGTSTYWGRGAVDKANIIILAVRRLGTTRSKKARTALCGMALVKDSLVSELYLDLICGSGWGRRLFNEVERIDRDFGKTRIRLSAVHDKLVTACSRLGYVEKDDACDETVTTKRWGNAENGYRMAKCLDVQSA